MKSKELIENAVSIGMHIAALKEVAKQSSIEEVKAAIKELDTLPTDGYTQFKKKVLNTLKVVKETGDFKKEENPPNKNSKAKMEIIEELKAHIPLLTIWDEGVPMGYAILAEDNIITLEDGQPLLHTLSDLSLRDLANALEGKIPIEDIEGVGYILESADTLAKKLGMEIPSTSLKKSPKKQISKKKTDEVEIN